MSTTVGGRGAQANGALVAVGGVVAAGAFMLWLLWALNTRTYDFWGGQVIGLLLAVVSIPLLFKAARNDPDPRVFGILFGALCLKLVAAYLRYWVSMEFYGGLYDAETYHDAGVAAYEAQRASGDSVWSLFPTSPGTPFLKEFTGFLYGFITPTRLGGFVVFSWIGFWGLFFFWKAAKVGVPSLDHRRYLLLLFFLPSMWFWPSSIGKEALVVCGLGFAAYGAALLLTGHKRGFLVLPAGLLLVGMIRPHVSLIVLAGLAVAYLLRRNPKRLSVLGPFGKLIGVGVIAVGLFFVTGRVATFFGVEGASPDALVSDTLERTTNQSSGGNSTIEVQRVDNPLVFPVAAFNVLFRPLIIEARNVPNLMAALEGTFLLGMVWVSRLRLRNVPRMMMRHAYVAFAVVYGVAFIFAFSAVANLGILSRQRTQVFPLLLLLLCLPVAEQARHAVHRMTRSEQAAEQRAERLRRLQEAMR